MNPPWWIQRGSQFPECTKPCPQHSSGASFWMSELRLCKRMISFNSAKVHPSAVLCLVAQSCLTLCNPMDCSQPGSSVHGDSSGKNTGGGCHVLLQGIFQTQGSNPSLPHCRWILYYLNHQGSPRILARVDYHFSRGSSWPRNLTRVSFITSGFFTSWATREAH